MNRMNHDSPFTALGNTRDTGEVAAQVAAIVRSFAPEHDLARVGGAFDLLDRAFAGNLSGYQQLNLLSLPACDAQLPCCDKLCLH